MKIFISVDDFCNDLDSFALKAQLLGTNTKLRRRECRMTMSERMTIYICFHLSSHTNFKKYYNQLVCRYWTDLFPNLLSYQRFNNLQNRFFVPLLMYMNNRCLGKSTGVSFIDSTTLNVCHIKREKQHKVFRGISAKSKSTMGWFFGLKLHLIVNDRGEILSFCFSKANVDDRDIKILKVMSKKVFGKLFGDRGYISRKLDEFLWNDGVELIYKRRKNMKKMNL